MAAQQGQQVAVHPSMLTNQRIVVSQAEAEFLAKMPSKQEQLLRYSAIQDSLCLLEQAQKEARKKLGFKSLA